MWESGNRRRLKYQHLPEAVLFLSTNLENNGTENKGLPIC
jgi:hypothetical protein